MDLALIYDSVRNWSIFPRHEKCQGSTNVGREVVSIYNLFISHRLYVLQFFNSLTACQPCQRVVSFTGACKRTTLIRGHVEKLDTQFGQKSTSEVLNNKMRMLISVKFFQCSGNIFYFFNARGFALKLYGSSFFILSRKQCHSWTTQLQLSTIWPH